jgi:hypothetical protein|tara:strand:+ start:167 stop:913 length:747 start_codon:yes stop_codon:yes gene_type:complete
MRVIKQGTVSDSNENAAYSFFSRNKDRFDEISLVSVGKTISLKGVTDILFVGGQTGSGSGAKPKTDIRIIHAGGTYNISLKKRSFGAWESADSLAGDRVSEKILGYLMDNLNGTAPSSRPFDVIAYVDGGRAKYKVVRKGTDTTVKLAYRCSIQDASTVIFGSDILGQGAVVSAEFPGACLLKNNIARINCSSIITTLSEVPRNAYPFFSVKSSFYRKVRNAYRFPGLRVQAMPRSEIKGSVEFLPEL